MKKEQFYDWNYKGINSTLMHVLASDKISFTYDPVFGLTFKATKAYIEKLKERLVTAYGSKTYPEFTLL